MHFAATKPLRALVVTAIVLAAGAGAVRRQRPAVHRTSSPNISTLASAVPTSGPADGR